MTSLRDEGSEMPSALEARKPVARRAETGSQRVADARSPIMTGEVVVDTIRSRGHLDELLDLVGEFGWNTAAGRSVFALMQAECARRVPRWRNTAGDLGDVGIAPMWVALDEWMAGDRRADPMGVMRGTAGRVYSREALAVEIGRGDPISSSGSKRLSYLAARKGDRVAAGVWSRRADSEVLDGHPSVSGEVFGDEYPVWMLILAAKLVKAGWGHPQPPGTCLAVVAMQTGRGRVKGSKGFVGAEAGISVEVWTALTLLLAGSGPGCREGNEWPGAVALFAAGGVAAVRDSVEVGRIVKAAVAGRSVRSGRKFLDGVGA